MHTDTDSFVPIRTYPLALVFSVTGRFSAFPLSVIIESVSRSTFWATSNGAFGACLTPNPNSRPSLPKLKPVGQSFELSILYSTLVPHK